MAVINKDTKKRLTAELHTRFNNLCYQLEGRELKSSTEGCKKGCWRHPETMCSLDSMKLRLATEDFNTILKELRKIK